MDFLSLCFVFIDILALFPRFCDRQVEKSRSRRVQHPCSGLRPERCCRRSVWHSVAQRLFVLFLCFHRHSRFVPSFLRSTSGGAQKSRGPTAFRPAARGSRSRHESRLLDSSTPRLLDSWTSGQEPQAGRADENRGRLRNITYPAGPNPLPALPHKCSLCCRICQAKNAKKANRHSRIPSPRPADGGVAHTSRRSLPGCMRPCGMPGSSTFAQRAARSERAHTSRQEAS